MVLSETDVFLAILAVTIMFSVLSVVLSSKEKLRIPIKIIAGLSWFVMALTQVYFLGGTHLLAVPLMFLFFGVGSVFCYSIVLDFKTEKNNRIWKFDED